MAMLIPFTLLAFLGIVCVYGTKMSVEEYLKQHTELSPEKTANELHEQLTQWDRSLIPADRDLTYPVANRPVPEVRMHLFGERKQRKRTRSRRQITPESCYLLFANRAHVIRMQNVPSLKISLVDTGLNNSVAVDFDKRDDCIFWSDVALRQIYQLCGDSDTPTVLVDTDIETPDGIAWDWVNKKLYWTDMGDRDLEMYDPVTGHRKVLFQFATGSKPRAIVLDPSTRSMYWTDWGATPTINSASMDGANHTVLHSTGLWWPNALTIDYDNQTLYWMDALLDRLEASNTDGSGRILLSTTHIYHPFSLTFLAGVGLFWSDWDLNALLAAPLNNLSDVNVVFPDLTLDPMGLTAACSERQPNITNPCDGRCHGELCLLSKSRPQGYSCSCTENSIARGLVDPVCEFSCGANGRCTGRNYCSCDDGWRGQTCDKGLCAEVCLHGECTGPNTCTCDDGWEGERCDQAVCCSDCLHGTCTSPRQCTCLEGWEGALCTRPVALPAVPTPTPPCTMSSGCKNGGSCKHTHCDCPTGYGGLQCEKDCRFQTCPQVD